MTTLQDQAKAAAQARILEVGALLGAKVVSEPENWQTRLELSPTIHLCASGGGYSYRDKIHWSASYPGAYRIGNCPSINTAIDRPAAAIVADLQRRLIPDAKKYCLECHQAEQAERARKAEAASRVAQLEQILGGTALYQSSGYGKDVHLPSLRLPSYQLEDRGGHRSQWSAEIEVYSWDCLLMIARLVAEDRRAWAAANPKKAEEDAT